MRWKNDLLFLLSFLSLTVIADQNCKRVTTVLFTGFEASQRGQAAFVINKINFREFYLLSKYFREPLIDENNSYKTVKQIEDDFNSMPELFGKCVRARFCYPVPVDFYESKKFVENCIKSAKPDDIYMLGESPHCDRINFETSANNHLSFGLYSDNAGFYPRYGQDMVNPDDRNLAVPSSLPLSELACLSSKEQAQSEKTRITFDVTPYNYQVCNALNFNIESSDRAKTEKMIRKKFRAGFIHLPEIKCDGSNPRSYAIALESLLNKFYANEAVDGACVEAQKVKFEYQKRHSIGILLPHVESAVCTKNFQTLTSEMMSGFSVFEPMFFQSEVPRRLGEQK